MSYLIRPMQLSDIRQVMLIERRSFTMPWPSFVYVHEINHNQDAYMGVIEVLQDADGEQKRLGLSRLWTREVQLRAPLAAYGGIWMDGDEGHISTIASAPDHRGKGFGELMLIALIGRAISMHRRRVVLEVRTSNTVAQKLYDKYHFKVHKTRYEYYPDNQEDAYLMVLEGIDQAYQEMLVERVADLRTTVEFSDSYSGFIDA
jgi:ribosomal-protein-alanine N-acetyltransferase